MFSVVSYPICESVGVQFPTVALLPDTRNCRNIILMDMLGSTFFNAPTRCSGIAGRELNLPVVGCPAHYPISVNVQTYEGTKTEEVIKSAR